MGVAFSPDGKKKEIKLKFGKRFTLRDISYIINGIVEIHFADNSWIFTNKLGAKLELTFNSYCTDLFGFAIYGICFIVPNDELEEQFFVPKELLEYQNSQEPVPQSSQDQIPSDDKLENDEFNKTDELRKRMDFYFRHALTQFFKKNKTYEDIKNDFIIFNDGKHMVRLEDTKDTRIGFLDRMILYFQELEEYEYCSQVLNFKQYLTEHT